MDNKQTYMGEGEQCTTQQEDSLYVGYLLLCQAIDKFREAPRTPLVKYALKMLEVVRSMIYFGRTV